MNGPNEIGKVKYTVEADVDVAKANINDIKSDIEGLGVSADTTGAKLDSAFVSVGGGMRKATASAQKFVGALTSTVGIATGLVAVISVMTGALVGLAALFKRLTKSDDDGSIVNFSEKLDKMADAVRGVDAALAAGVGLEGLQESLEKSGDRVDFFREQISQVTGGFDEKDLLPSLEKKLNKELKKQITIRQQISDLIQSINDKQDDAIEKKKRESEAEQNLIARLEKRKQIFQSLTDIADDARIALIVDDEERDQAILSRQKNSLIAAAKAVGIEEGESKLQIAFELMDAVSRKQIQENKDITDKKKADELAAIDLVAKKQAEALAKALNTALTGVADSLFGSFGNTITTRLDSITDELQQISRVNGRR